MTLKTLGKTTWSRIKVGEVFAHNGCWQVMYKKSDNIALFLCDDFADDFWSIYYLAPTFGNGHPTEKLYKLPLSTQRLWKTECLRGTQKTSCGYRWRQDT